jgi:hypothetical protein
MRIFEFSAGSDTLRLAFKNLIGNAQRKRQPAQFNWAAIGAMLKPIGLGQIDYYAFKKIYDTTPAIQSMIRDFNADGIELRVPGVGSDEETNPIDQSKAEVDKIASGAAADQLKQ